MKKAAQSEEALIAYTKEELMEFAYYCIAIGEYDVLVEDAHRLCFQNINKEALSLLKDIHKDIRYKKFKRHQAYFMSVSKKIQKYEDARQLKRAKAYAVKKGYIPKGGCTCSK